MNSEPLITNKLNTETQYPSFDLMCRFCLKCDPILHPIFVKNEIDTLTSIHNTTPVASFTKMIHICIGLDVKKNDEFPKFICSNCTNQLKNSFAFRQQCLSSFDKLKELIVGRTSSNNLLNSESSAVDPVIKLENLLSVIAKRKYTKRKSRSKSLECVELKNNEENNDEDGNNDNDVDNFNDNDDYFNDNDDDDLINDQSLKFENCHESKNIKKESISVKVTKKRRRKSGKKDEFSTTDDNSETTPKKDRGKHKNREKAQKGQRIPKERAMQICPICGEQRLSIEHHILTMHTDEKPCCCGICGKWIKTKSNLIGHHQRVHVAVRKYHCDICKFSFKTRAHIIRHMLSHAKIRNYECHICGNRFRDSHTKSIHVRLHAEDKRIKCPYCDKRFMAPNRLKNHIGIHTGEMPYNCELCPKQFKYSASSTIHRREHMINKSYYQCGSCEFQVRPFSLLKVHLRTEKHFFNEYFSANDTET